MVHEREKFYYLPLLLIPILLVLQQQQDKNGSFLDDSMEVPFYPIPHKHTTAPLEISNLTTNFNKEPEFQLEKYKRKLDSNITDQNSGLSKPKNRKIIALFKQRCERAGIFA